MEELLLLTEDHLHQFGARQATNVLWSLAHLHSLHPSGCAALASEMLPMMKALLPWCEPQHLSNIIWAVAKLEEVCPGLGPDDVWLEEFLVCSERTMKVGSDNLSDQTIDHRLNHNNDNYVNPCPRSISKSG